jgi:group II intron reverse transcriptase/maturase
MHHLNEFNLRRAFRDLDGSKASGIDQVTKNEYEKQLLANIENLKLKIQDGGWRPKPSREKLIPKPTGGMRPLAIGCLEDKIVQNLCAKILEAIYEPIFHSCSYGFRRGKSQHQALARVHQEIRLRKDACVVVEMDIEKFFNTIPHDKLMALIKLRITDTSFLRLINRMLKNSILSEDGEIRVNEAGTPQGSPISPVLSNIYLHYALDQWFQENWVGRGQMIRYADDAVFVFARENDAQDFRRALEARLEDYGIKLNGEKSGLVRFNERKPEGDVPFLGFVFYWGCSATKRKLLKVKTAPKRLAASIQRFKEWIKAERNRHRLVKIWSLAATKLQGHYNYYGVRSNLAKLQHFYHECVNELFKWLNRRSQKRSYTWEGFLRRLKFDPLPKPPTSGALIDIENGLGTKLKHKLKSRVRENRTHGSNRSSGRQRPLFT